METIIFNSIIMKMIRLVYSNISVALLHLIVSDETFTRQSLLQLLQLYLCLFTYSCNVIGPMNFSCNPILLSSDGTVCLL